MPNLQKLKTSLWRAQRGSCAICGERMQGSSTYSIDHVLPLSRGGDNAGNRVAAHRVCNTTKADRWPTGCELIWLMAVNAQLAKHKPKYLTAAEPDYPAQFSGGLSIDLISAIYSVSHETVVQRIRTSRRRESANFTSEARFTIGAQP